MIIICGSYEVLEINICLVLLLILNILDIFDINNNFFLILIYLCGRDCSDCIIF